MPLTPANPPFLATKLARGMTGQLVAQSLSLAVSVMTLVLPKFRARTVAVKFPLGVATLRVESPVPGGPEYGGAVGLGEGVGVVVGIGVGVGVGGMGAGVAAGRGDNSGRALWFGGFLKLFWLEMRTKAIRAKRERPIKGRMVMKPLWVGSFILSSP